MMRTAQTTSSKSRVSDTHPWQRWRVVLIRAWAGLLTVQTLLMAHGILVVGSVDPELRFMAASSTMFKLLTLGGVAFVLWTGGRSVAAYWAIGVGQLVWILAEIFAPQPDANGLLLGLVVILLYYGPLVALRPRRRELLHPGFAVSRVPLSFALVASVPLVWFAVHLSSTLNAAHAFDMVGLYLAIAAMGLFGSLRPQGAAVLAPLVGLGAVYTGLAGLFFPAALASPGTQAGALMVAAGLAYAAVADSRFA